MSETAISANRATGTQAGVEPSGRAAVISAKQNGGSRINLTLVSRLGSVNRLCAGLGVLLFVAMMNLLRTSRFTDSWRINRLWLYSGAEFRMGQTRATPSLSSNGPTSQPCFLVAARFANSLDGLFLLTR